MTDPYYTPEELEAMDQETKRVNAQLELKGAHNLAWEAMSAFERTAHRSGYDACRIAQNDTKGYWSVMLNGRANPALQFRALPGSHRYEVIDHTADLHRDMEPEEAVLYARQWGYVEGLKAKRIG